MINNQLVYQMAIVLIIYVHITCIAIVQKAVKVYLQLQGHYKGTMHPVETLCSSVNAKRGTIRDMKVTEKQIKSTWTCQH